MDWERLVCILKTPSVVAYPFKFDCISKIPCTLINAKFYGRPFVSKLWHGICAVFAHVYLQFFKLYGFLSHVYDDFLLIRPFNAYVSETNTRFTVYTVCALQKPIYLRCTSVRVRAVHSRCCTCLTSIVWYHELQLTSCTTTEKQLWKKTRMAPLRKESFVLMVLMLIAAASLPTANLLESVDCLLRDCDRYIDNADRNMAEHILSYDWTDSILVLRDALDPGEAENTERIPLLETLGDTASDFIKQMGVAGNCTCIVHVHLPYQ